MKTPQFDPTRSCRPSPDEINTGLSPAIGKGGFCDIARALYADSFDGVILTEPAGRILAANSVACRLLALREEQLLKLTRMDLVRRGEPREPTRHGFPIFRCATAGMLAGPQRSTPLARRSMLEPVPGPIVARAQPAFPPEHRTQVLGVLEARCEGNFAHW